MRRKADLEYAETQRRGGRHPRPSCCSAISAPLRLCVKELPALLALTFLASEALAQEQKPNVPRITAVVPLEVTPGSTATVRVRGVKLAAASKVQFLEAKTPLTAVIKEKKAADVPNGLDAKDVGDSLIEFTLTVPAELPGGLVNFRVVTPDGTTAPAVLRVIEAAALVEEREPNGSFREAQPVELGKTVRGVVKEDKDVDVFQFAGRAGQKIAAEVIAGRGASLLDSSLTLTDVRGQFLATNDDSGGTRDSALTFTLPADGPYFFSVIDAQDRGTAWHSYEFIVKEVP